MATVNEINPKLDLTVRVFDNFYDFAVEVPADEYDAVYSFFLSVMADAQAAANFTTTLFRISSNTGIPVLTILSEFEGQTAIQLNSTLAYYLNGLRSPTTLLGINAAVTPNYYTARNVLP